MRSEPDDPPLFRRAATAAEAEQIARDFGVTADYGDYLTIANLINEALSLLVTRGITVSAPIRIDPYAFVLGGEVLRDIVGTYSERDGTIRFNPLARYWDAPGTKSRTQFDDRWWASPHSLAPVLHEIGHALHLGARDRSVPVPSDCAAEEDRAVADELGDFAATSPVEFVAEAFVVLITRGTLTERVRRLYERLGGPES